MPGPAGNIVTSKILSTVLLLFAAAIPLSVASALAQSANNNDHPKPNVVMEARSVRALPGGLNEVPVFNSNSPEMVLSEGILLSTFPPEGKGSPSAHLNYPLSGRFDIFAHHVAKGQEDDERTLYVGIVLGNAGAKSAKVRVLSGASYLSQPDAPFVPLEPIIDNEEGDFYSGPGDRVMNEVLRQEKSLPDSIRDSVTVPAGKTAVLASMPIPIKGLLPRLNGRSTLLQLESSGPVYVATLALFSKPDKELNQHPPEEHDWLNILQKGLLCSPRDKTPTRPQAPGAVTYGRVAGVAKGNQWIAHVTDVSTKQATESSQTLAAKITGTGPEKGFLSSRYLTIPEPGNAYSFPLATVSRGTFGTNQVQSAPMLVRYPDTAYAAHGNYGVRYHIELPLHNSAFTSRVVNVFFQFPLKTDETTEILSFYDPPSERTFFRGTVRVKYKDDDGKNQEKYYHLVGRQGAHGSLLARLSLDPDTTKNVEVDFLYPPDSTPPQVLTIETENDPVASL